MNDLRRTLLKVMLGGLAVAALAGVVAVLTGSTDVTARGAGSAALVSVAAALALPMARLVDKPASRAAGLLGMAWVLAEFGLGLMLIWGVAEALWGWDGSGAVAASMAALVPCSLVTMAMLRLRAEPQHGPAAVVGSVVAAITLLCWCLGAWYEVVIGGTSWRIASDLGASGAAIGGYGLLATAAMIDWRERLHRPWRWAGVGLAAAAALLCLVGIWADLESGGAVVVCLTATAIVVAHANLTSTAVLVGAQQRLRSFAIGAVAVAAILVSLMSIYDIDAFGVDTMFGRIAAAAVILGACASVAILVVAWMNRRPEAPAAQDVQTISLTCPHCRQKHDQPVGNSSCPTCGLRFHITVREPICEACGYLLYGNTTGRCPECGTQTAAPTITA